MSARQCWTCNSRHDLDEACPASDAVRRQRNRGSLDDATVDDLFHEAQESFTFGPVFMAQYACDDDCCGEGIEPGEDIRANGQGGWIHAATTCERLARS